MNFIMMRDRVVSSVTGHSVSFKKGVATHVPPEMYAEVMAVGAVPEEELPEEEPAKGPVEPTDPVEREEAVMAAFTTLVTRNVREDFTAGGAPHAKALQRELGWTLHNKERDILWVKFCAGTED